MFKVYMEYLKARIGNEKGQGMVEYGLIISLIAIAVILVLTGMGGKLKDLFTSVSDNLKTTP